MIASSPLVFLSAFSPFSSVLTIKQLCAGLFSLQSIVIGSPRQRMFKNKTSGGECTHTRPSSLWLFTFPLKLTGKRRVCVRRWKIGTTARVRKLAGFTSESFWGKFGVLEGTTWMSWRGGGIVNLRVICVNEMFSLVLRKNRNSSFCWFLSNGIASYHKQFF